MYIPVSYTHLDVYKRQIQYGDHIQFDLKDSGTWQSVFPDKQQSFIETVNEGARS